MLFPRIVQIQPLTIRIVTTYAYSNYFRFPGWRKSEIGTEFSNGVRTYINRVWCRHQKTIQNLRESVRGIKGTYGVKNENPWNLFVNDFDNDSHRICVDTDIYIYTLFNYGLRLNRVVSRLDRALSIHIGMLRTSLLRSVFSRSVTPYWAMKIYTGQNHFGCATLHRTQTLCY